MRRWRKMTWILIVWSVLILVGVLGAATGSDGQTVADCANGGYLRPQNCQNVTDAFNVALVLIIGFVGFTFLAAIWFMTRPRGRRDCPVCGECVKKGQTACPSCGHDFAAAARSAPVSP